MAFRRVSLHSQPTSCMELNLLGYTLNGFYAVKVVTVDDDPTSSFLKIAILYCAFKRPAAPAAATGDKISNKEFKGIIFFIINCHFL